MKEFTRRLFLVGLFATATSQVHAGNIVITGHDDEYHRSVAANAALTAFINFVRNGSSLPVLTFDSGTQLTNALSALGVPYVNVDPNAGVPSTSLFNTAVYSAIAVASDSSCGGCDNSATGAANLAAASSSIASFFKVGYLQSEVGNPVFNGGWEAGRFVQNLVARHEKQEVRSVQYRVGFRRANVGSTAVAVVVRYESARYWRAAY